MGTAAIQALLAGLGGASSSLGASLDARDQAAEAEKMKQAASDRALKQLLAVEAAKEAGNGEWEKAEPFTLPDNTTVMAERSRRTGQYRPVNITGQPSGPRAPTLPVGMEDVGDSQDMTGAGGGADAAMVKLTGAPVASTQGGPARPYVKPTATLGERTPRSFTENGKPVEGFADKTGNFYHADGTRATGVITPYAAPKEEPLVQVQGPDGTPMWVKRSDAEGKPARQTTRIESATNTAAQARLEAAVSEMNNAHANMSEYEAKLANGTADISGLNQFIGSVANTFTHDDPLSKAAQTTALAILNRTNPELARYIRRGLSFAEGESMISQRPSDFRTRMAAFLSTAASGASPDMVKDIESRRTAILIPLNRVVRPTGSVSPIAPKAAPKQEKTVAPAPHPLAGVRDAILDKYGLTPKPDDED